MSTPRVLHSGPNFHCVSYPPGFLPDELKAGDILLVRNVKESIISQAIQAGERAEFGNTDWARWTHAALVEDSDGHILEELDRGMAQSHIVKYKDNDFALISPQVPQSLRDEAVNFMRSLLGTKYGYAEIVGEFMYGLTGKKLALQEGNDEVCSASVSRATERYIIWPPYSYPHPAALMKPADLAYFWGYLSNEPLVPLRWFGRLLNAVSYMGHAIFRKVL